MTESWSKSAPRVAVAILSKWQGLISVAPPLCEKKLKQQIDIMACQGHTTMVQVACSHVMLTAKSVHNEWNEVNISRVVTVQQSNCSCRHTLVDAGLFL
jgi:hypothetical protein